MTPLAYPAARAVAAGVLPHIERDLAAARPELQAGVTVPSGPVIEALVETAFWASLRREEGFVPRISLAYVRPDQSPSALCFERSLPFASASLTRLAPAVERPGIHLAVWGEGRDLIVWGATRKLPAYCFVLEVVAPGLLVVKHSRGEESGKFVNVAVLQGDELKIIDQRTALEPDCPALLTSLLGLDSQFETADSVNVLIQLAVSMRAHGRGGLLLVVPTGSERWRESILSPILYGVSPPYTNLSDLMQEDPSERPRRRWQEALKRAVDGVAGLTAVDGATVITRDYHLLAFGAKIVRRQASPMVAQVIVTEPVEGSSPAIMEPSQIGGTRHLSAAQFAHDQRDAIALVASQDGHFTVFGWSPCEAMVHAHRIETLLL